MQSTTAEEAKIAHIKFDGLTIDKVPSTLTEENWLANLPTIRAAVFFLRQNNEKAYEGMEENDAIDAYFELLDCVSNLHEHLTNINDILKSVQARLIIILTRAAQAENAEKPDA